MATDRYDPLLSSASLESRSDHVLVLEALRDVSAALCRQNGQRETIREVLSILDKRLGMRRATVMLLSPEGDELVVEAARGGGGEVVGKAKYRRGEGVTGEVLRSGRSAIVPSIAREPRFQDRVHRRRESEQEDCAFICVPVSLENMVLGTLSVDVAPASDALLAEHERCLEIVAGIIANDAQARRMRRMQEARFESEALLLRSALGERFRPENIIGNSTAMNAVYRRIHQVAPTDTTALIRGESGTGKELVASALHALSARNRRSFVRVNCAALNENLLESELFGHERGAFTGALQTRVGRIEEAEGGTLFFDEIGDFSPAVQVKLLRVLQEREFERVGSNIRKKADVRVVAATNRDLEKAVESGAFREDLYYRVNVFPIVLPPLRERPDDIPLLADFFVKRFAAMMNKPVRRISTTAINMMLAYHWPGNVRELENCVEHAVLLTTGDTIDGNSLPPTLQMPNGRSDEPPGSLRARVETLERDMIIDALKRNGGRTVKAAEELGITPRMVRYKMMKLGIDAREAHSDKT
jgi:Nif-specific regulatory protein